MRGLLKLLIVFAALVSLLFAEINPLYYRQMQESAGERLKIRVSQVSRDWYFWRSTRKVSVDAEVVAVGKTATGIAPGNRIYFEYEIFTPPADGWVGPRPMPPLFAGKEYDFFGERVGVAKDKGIILNPGARGYSFESLLD